MWARQALECCKQSSVGTPGERSEQNAYRNVASEHCTQDAPDRDKGTIRTRLEATPAILWQSCACHPHPEML